MNIRIPILVFALIITSEAVSGAYPSCCSSQTRQLVIDAGLDIPEISKDTIVDIGCINGYPVNVELINGVVCHIGISIFDSEKKLAFGKRISNFIERYFLYTVCSYDSENMEIFKGKNIVTRGSLSAILNCLNSEYSVSLVQDDQTGYAISWIKEGQEVLFLSFPANCELIFGMNKIELEKYFAFELLTHKNVCCSISDINSPKTRIGEDVYFDYRGSFAIEAMRQGLYYEIRDSSYSLIFNQALPTQSIHNILTEPSLAEGYLTELHIHQYGFKNRIETVPLSNIIDLCLSNGCEPYVGFEQTDSDEKFVAVIIMEKTNEGYNHILKVDISKDDLSDKNKTLYAEINVYVPTSGLKSLFDDKNQVRHIKDYHKIKI